MTKGGFLRNIYYSDNDGGNWNSANTGDVDWNFLTVSNNGTLFAVSPIGGTGQLGVIKSTNNGSSWSNINTNVPLTSARCITKDLNGDLFLISDEYNIKKSINDGSIWTDFSSVPSNEIGLNLLFTANQIFLITTNADYTIFKIYYSNKNNINWQNITSQFSSNTTFNELKYIDNKVFVCTSNGLFYYDTSTNNYSDTCNNVSGSLTQGLVGYWPFCGNANDDSGNGNNGTVNGATLTTDRFGNSNSSYSFDGVNNFISVPSNSSISPTNSLTLSCWVYVNNSNAWNQFVTKRFSDNISPFNSYIIAENNNGQGSSENYTSGIKFANNSVSLNDNNSLPINVWYNYVLVYDGSTMKLYRNGILVNSISASGEISYSSLPLYFGSTGVIGQCLNGKLDDIGIWNRALTPTEVTQLYNQNQCFTNTTVTDTLIINVGQLSYTNPIAYANNIIIAPNPASTQININFNNITNLNGGTLKIINSLGQEVATTPITTSGTNSTMQLATWGGTGMYFVQIINPQGQIVDIKKIILQ